MHKLKDDMIGDDKNNGAGVSNVTQEPLLLHVRLQFYYSSYFVICVQQRPTKNPMFYKISAILHGTTIACFKSL